MLQRKEGREEGGRARDSRSCTCCLYDSFVVESLYFVCFFGINLNFYYKCLVLAYCMALCHRVRRLEPPIKSRIFFISERATGDHSTLKLFRLGFGCFFMASRRLDNDKPVVGVLCVSITRMSCVSSRLLLFPTRLCRSANGGDQNSTVSSRLNGGGGPEKGASWGRVISYHLCSGGDYFNVLRRKMEQWFNLSSVWRGQFLL